MFFEYLKLNMQHPDYIKAKQQAVDFMKLKYPANLLGINESKDGTAAWVKLIPGHGIAGSVVLDSANYGTRDKIFTDIQKVAWTPPEPKESETQQEPKT